VMVPWQSDIPAAWIMARDADLRRAFGFRDHGLRLRAMTETTSFATHGKRSTSPSPTGSGGSTRCR